MKKYSEQKAIDSNAMETIIRLKDSQYPLQVVMHYVAYKKENVIKTWTEISHQEKKPIRLNVCLFSGASRNSSHRKLFVRM